MIFLSGDRSLSRLAVDRFTSAVDYPVSIPRGVLKNGVIQFGDNAGKDIFEISRDVFEKKHGN